MRTTTGINSVQTRPEDDGPQTAPSGGGGATRHEIHPQTKSWDATFL